MKKQLYNIFTFSCCMFVLSGCEDDLLTQTNPNVITADTYWKSKSDYDKAVVTLYASLQLPSVSGSEVTHDMLKTDLFGTEAGWMDKDFVQFRWVNSTSYVISRWSELYVGINRANQIIENLKNASFLNEDDKNLIRAQAEFLRAYDYFFLAWGYNGAVIQLKVPTTKEEMNIPFSSKDDVINNVVIPDLMDAVKYLPKTWSDSEKGKFTWGAAKAMLGKVYLYNKDFKSAETYFKSIIDEAESTGLYKLMPDYFDNFTEEKEFNSESVLEVGYSLNFKTGSNASIYDESNGTEAQQFPNIFSSYMVGGYNTCLPTYWLQELFVSGDQMDMTKSINKDKSCSRRTYASIVVEHGDGDYYQHPLIETIDKDGITHSCLVNFAYGQGSKVKKWINWYDKSSEDASTGCPSGINIRLIRYSDILLMYAECLLEADNDVANAIKYIDIVRSRAAVITLQEYMDKNNGQIPRLDVSSFAKYQLSDGNPKYDFVPATKENVLRHLRMVERPLELAFEGQRWFDLLRWGIIKEVFDERYEEQKKIVSYLCDKVNDQIISSPDAGGKPKMYPLYLNERVRDDFSPRVNNYNSSFDYFPIPSVELNNNSAVREQMNKK